MSTINDYYNNIYNINSNTNTNNFYNNTNNYNTGSSESTNGWNFGSAAPVVRSGQPALNDLTSNLNQSTQFAVWS